ncbi:integrin-linked protein kinase 1-like isoform X3 [Nicotiana sylvestris]|uniref:integrin-linked protein kinase 1-like isoform X3 n=1 Tax=Nicotiana sylvestris TaxID=4096 RepID=UPI00388CD258
MEVAAQLKRGILRQFSTGSFRKSGKFSFKRQNSFDPRRNNLRFSFGRQSSLDPIRRSSSNENGELSVPDNLDSTMQLLFMACKGDVKGVQDLLDEGIDVNSIDLDGRTALHIAACEGHVEVVKLLLSRKANMDGRDRWGSTAVADAKYYGNAEIYNILKARGAKVPKNRKTPMAVANPREVPEYELNPLELQIRRSDGISKGSYQIAKWNGTKVSVKILDKDSYTDPESIDAFKHELTLLEKVRHPNVVQFVGAVTQNIPMMIVSEYHPRGDLGSYLQKKGRLSPSKGLRFALDVARNILLDNGGLLKVAGFGLIRLSKISPDKAKLVQPEAADRSSPYVAPEIYKDEIFDRNVDIYSFGIVLYEMMEGRPPFHTKSPQEAARMMCLEGQRPAFKSKSKYPPELRELIEECWDPEAFVRPTFSEIIVRMNKIAAYCSKQGWLKDTFKLPWL